MRAITVAGLVLSSFTVGALSAAMWFNAVPAPWNDHGVAKATPGLDRMSTRRLGRVLLGRVADGFVADSRSQQPLKNGVAFYDQPTPAGQNLCYVRAHLVPARIVAGAKPERDVLRQFEVATLYGVWTDPSKWPGGEMTDQNDRERRAACASYSDFEHLISGDVAAVDRGVSLMDRARDQAVAGAIEFKLECVDRRRRYEGTTCDGVAFLRAIDLKKIRWVEAQSDDMGEGVETAVDRVSVMTGRHQGEHPELLTYIIASRRPYGQATEILSVKVEADAL